MIADYFSCHFCGTKSHSSKLITTTKGYSCPDCYFATTGPSVGEATAIAPNATANSISANSISKAVMSPDETISTYLRSLPSGIFEATLAKHVLILDDRFLKALMLSEGMLLADTDCIGSCSCEDSVDPDMVFVGRGDGTILGWHTAADGVREQHAEHLSQELMKELRLRHQDIMRKKMRDSTDVAERASALRTTAEWERIRRGPFNGNATTIGIENA